MVVYLCDGCERALEHPNEVGHILKRQYCDRCAKLAEAFLDEEEAARRAAHEKFIDERAALIAKYAMRLPDVP